MKRRMIGWMYVGVLLACGAAFGGEISSVTFTQKQWLDTGVSVKTNSRVVCDFQLTRVPTEGASFAVFGSLGQTTNYINTGWGLRAHSPTDGNVSVRDLWTGWSGNNYTFLSNATQHAAIDTARHVVEVKNGSTTFDGMVFASDGPARDPATTSGGRLWPFAVGCAVWPGGNPSSLAPVRIFAIKFYEQNGAGEDDTLVKDFVPWEQDGLFGLYDKVNAAFIPAQGTQELLAGVWTTAPSVTPSAWDRRAGVTPAISNGAVTNAATVTCSHTAAQLAALPVGCHRVTFTTQSEVAEFNGRTAHVIVTVSESLAATPSADGATLTLTFPPASEARELHLVYGTANKGSNPASWPHETTVAVPANATTLTVAKPDAVGSENPVWSAILHQPASAKSALSYVRHGNLVMQWDGEENAAYGQHDAARTCPAEIRRGLACTATGSLAADARSFRLGSGYFTFASPILQYLINQGRATVEIAMSDAGLTRVGNGGFFSFGNTSRGFWFYQKGFVGGDLSYHAQMTDHFDTLNVADNQWTSNFPSTNTFSFVLGPTTNTSFAAYNGTQWKLSHCDAMKHLNNTCLLGRYFQDVEDTAGYVGILPGKWFNNGNGPKAQAHICSIRVYDRALSLADVQANAAVDRARFGAGGFQQVGPYYEEIPLTVKAVNKEGTTPVSADLVFTGAAQTRRLSFAWGPNDAGAALTNWPNVVQVATVPAGQATYTATIPAAARAAIVATGGFRFFLDEPVSAASYAQGDHLVAQFDGIENGGFGVHESGRTAPVELRHDLAVTATGTLTNEARHIRLGTHSFKFDCPDLLKAVNEGHATVELVLATNGLPRVNNGGYFCIGNSTRGFWYYEKQSYFGDLSYHAPIVGNQNSITAYDIVKGTNTISFVLGETTEASSISMNAQKLSAQLTRFTTPCTNETCFVGRLAGKANGTNYYDGNYRPRVNLYSLRLYDCVLTAEEQARNVRIDAQRFRDEFTCYEASAYLRATPKGTLLLVR